MFFIKQLDMKNQQHILRKICEAETFTIVLQEEEQLSIRAEVESDPRLRQMIQDSRADYKLGNDGLNKKQLLQSISPNP